MSEDKSYSSNLYLENGYINIDYLMSLNMTLYILIGGRGIGKTYGLLQWLRNHDIAPLFLRRTQAQSDIVNSEAMSPWKSIAKNDKFLFKVTKAGKGLTETYECDKDDKKIKTLSLGAALSTLSNLRGFDSSDIDYIVLDEFIPETHERPIKNEADILLNAYETINRNRELSGIPPVKLILMANANRLDSPVLMKLGLVNKIEKMIKNKQDISIMPEKSLCIALYHDSPISNKKRDTFIYRLTKGTQFEEMAVNNDFSYSDTSNVVSLPLNGKVPLFKFDDITAYTDKTTNRLYFSKHTSGTVKCYDSTSDEDLARLRRDKMFVSLAILSNIIDYESFEIKAKVMSIFAL